MDMGRNAAGNSMGDGWGQQPLRNMGPNAYGLDWREAWSQTLSPSQGNRTFIEHPSGGSPGVAQ